MVVAQTSGKTALLMDGAYVIKRWEKDRRQFPGVADVVRLGTQLMAGLPGADLYRIFFYAADPYRGTAVRPRGGKPVNFAATKTARNNERLLEQLEESDDFAVRRGEVAFRGWRVGDSANRALQRDPHKVVGGEDFVPHLVQKGVDMRVGLDMAAIALKRLVNTVVLVTGDADMVPAMRFARREGLRVGLCPFGFGGIRPELRSHADFIVDWSPATVAVPTGPASPASPR